MGKKHILGTFLPLVLALFLVSSAFASFLVPQTPLPGKSIDKYVDEVTRPGRIDGTNDLTIQESEFQQKMLPHTFTYPAPFEGTYVWGFGATDGDNTFAPAYPGPTVITRRGANSRTNVFYDNQLYNHTNPAKPLVLQKYLTVDQTLHWADPLGNTSMMGCTDSSGNAVNCMLPANKNNPCCKPYLGPVPVTVHLHGAETPSAFDGHPDTWWTPDLNGDGKPDITGPSYVSNNYTYINSMEPTTLWYHDHALGMTRINIYSGLAGFYFIRGNGDTGVPGQGLNLPSGNQELELLIADRQFDTNGQLLFPDGYPAGLNGGPSNPMIHPFWIPEFFGDTIVVNGQTWPRMTVEPRRYRFRILNGSNARFYNLSLKPMLKGPTPSMWVIGTDGGLLDKPIRTNELLVGVAERYDVIIDFSQVPGGVITMTNSAKAPFPAGTAADPQTVGQVMRFFVGKNKVNDTSFNPATPGATLRGNGKPLPAIVRLVDGKGGLAKGVAPYKTRQLVLKEIIGPTGEPLEVLLNNTKWNGKRFGGVGPEPPAGFDIPGSKTVGAIDITELPVVGSTEVWEIINLTGDAHPIHVHLGQFQLVNRQAFNVTTYGNAYNQAFPSGQLIPEYGPPLPYDQPNGDGALGGNPAISPYLQGPVMPPKAYEFGWKDTWVMLPGQVTRIVVRIAPQDRPVRAVQPGDNFFAFDPTATLGTTDSFGFPGGPGYIWHCHILDHEDNEMMRPYIPVNLSDDQQ